MDNLVSILKTPSLNHDVMSKVLLCTDLGDLFQGQAQPQL